MRRVTFYVALPIIRTAHGMLTPEQAVEAPSAGAALRATERLTSSMRAPSPSAGSAIPTSSSP